MPKFLLLGFDLNSDHGTDVVIRSPRWAIRHIFTKVGIWGEVI